VTRDRANGNPRLIVIYWRDVPAQVNAQRGRERVSLPLPRPFQYAVERASFVSKQKNAHDFVRHWRRTDRPCGDDLNAAAQAEFHAVVAAYPEERLRALIAAGGTEDSDSWTNVV
jgi:hypothetical protein